MKVHLDTLLTIVAGISVFLALNGSSTSMTNPQEVLPCIIVSFSEVPQGYETRIPSGGLAGNALRTRLQDEMMAKNISITRGWPFAFQKDSGFIYELDNGTSWIGIPESALPRQRFSILAFTANACVVSIPTFAICLFLRFRRRPKPISSAHSYRSA